MTAKYRRHDGPAPGRGLAGPGVVRRTRSRPSSAYLLLSGCACSGRAIVAAGSPAAGEEGFAPAGFILAAGVLAFAAPVPAVAFSPFGVPAPLHRHRLHRHPRRLATMIPALPPRPRAHAGPTNSRLAWVNCLRGESQAAPIREKSGMGVELSGSEDALGH